MHLVLHVGAQPDHGALDDDVEQPRLQPDHQCGNQIQRERKRQRACDRAEVDALTGHDVHARQQIRVGGVAAGAGGLDRLLLGHPGGQPTADHPVEQQIGGMPEDAGTDDADRDAADPEQHHRDGHPALRHQLFQQPDGRALEVAGAFLRGFGHPDPARERPAHRSPAVTDCESENSRYASQVCISCSWVPVPTTRPSSMTTI